MDFDEMIPTQEFMEDEFNSRMYFFEQMKVMLDDNERLRYWCTGIPHWMR